VEIVGGVLMTIVGAPWTTGTVSAGGLTAMGGASPASAIDTITLVTPVVILTDVAAFATPAFFYLTLTGLSVPEPGTAVLLALGVGGLVAAGRSRRA
jgi:hypothetical protein